MGLRICVSMMHCRAIVTVLSLCGIAGATKYKEDSFFLVNVASGRALAMSPNLIYATQENNNAIPHFVTSKLSGCDGIDDRQLFVHSNTSKTIRNLVENRCADVANVDFSSGNVVVAQICHGMPNEQWDLVPVAAESIPGVNPPPTELQQPTSRQLEIVMVKVASQQVCLRDDLSDTAHHKTKIIQVPPVGAPHADQSLLWRKVSITDYMKQCIQTSFFVASKSDPNLVLSIKDGRFENGDSIVLVPRATKRSELLSQLWRYKSDTKSISSLRAPDMALDLHGGNKRDVILYGIHNGPNQQWNLDLTALQDKNHFITISNNMGANPGQKYYLKASGGSGSAIICEQQAENGQLGHEFQWSLSRWEHQSRPQPHLVSEMPTRNVFTAPPMQLPTAPPMMNRVQPAIVPPQSFDAKDTSEFVGMDCECE
jgi:hypothetical protein